MAITRDEHGRVFDYDTVNRVFDELAAVEIGKHTVSRESMDKINELLDLEHKVFDGPEALRAVRNAVVVLFGKKEREEANIGEDGYALPGKGVDYDKMMYWSTKISGITAVIDKYLYDAGGMF